MKRLNVLATAAVLVLGLGSSLAQADPDHRRGRGHPPSQGKGHAGPDRHDRQGPQGRLDDQRRYDRDDMRRPGPPQHIHSGRQGAGPQHNWVRGSRLPPQYRGYQYVITDWRGHGLSRPPRGHHWVQYGGDYLLVAIATGVIVQLILSH